MSCCSRLNERPGLGLGGSRAGGRCQASRHWFRSRGARSSRAVPFCAGRDRPRGGLHLHLGSGGGLSRAGAEALQADRLIPVQGVDEGSEVAFWVVAP
eukprot:1283320-Alexandrium_andersonii.AAC.1